MSEISGAAGVLELERPMPMPGPEALPPAPVMPEMPTAHANVDPQTLTRDGLIKACPYFAGVAAKNPALAEKLADGALQAAQHHPPGETGPADPLAALREQRKQKAAERAKAKAAKQAAAEAEPARSEPAQEAVTPEAVAESPTPSIEPAKLRPALTEVLVAPIIQPAGPAKPTRVAKTEASTKTRKVEVAASSVVATPVEMPPLARLEVAAPLPVVIVQESKPAPVPEARIIEPKPIVLPDIEPVPASVPVPILEAMTSYEPEPPVVAEAAPDAEVEVAQISEPQPFTYDLPEIITAEPLPAPALAPTFEAATFEAPVEASAVPPVEQVTWTDELDKEPAEVYEDFTEALQAVVVQANEASPSLVAVIAPAETANAPLASKASEVTSASPVPPIVVAVAERLTTIEPRQKETALPVVRQMITARQTVEMLVVEKAEPKTIEVAVAQLQEQIVVLFEQLGIEYAPEDVEQFMGVLFRPDFLPPQPEPSVMQTADLENDGTHEAKSPWLHWATTVWDEVERDMHHLLGSFVLFKYMTPSVQAASTDS